MGNCQATLDDPGGVFAGLDGSQMDRAIAMIAAANRVGVFGGVRERLQIMAETGVARLNARELHMTAVLATDGLHFDDFCLVPVVPRRRKGAPETFAVGGLAHMLQRLRAWDAPVVAVPVFDRANGIARAGARLIPAEVRVIVVGGNWLLLTRAPLGDPAPFFDVTVFLDLSVPVLRERLPARWRKPGLPADEAEAQGLRQRSARRPRGFRRQPVCGLQDFKRMRGEGGEALFRERRQEGMRPCAQSN